MASQAIHRRWRRLLLAVVLATCLLNPASAPAQEVWGSLAAARTEFERAAWQADFVQTYVPAGFTSGERETGRLAMTLPGRMRWDYSLPYDKVFLIRGAEAYTWNPGETTGRKALLEAGEREHLALLELDTASLRELYSASIDTRDPGILEILFEPLDRDTDIRSAYLALEPSTHRILELSYSDLEGNETRFELSGHRIAAQADLFDPPPDLDWLED